MKYVLLALAGLLLIGCSATPTPAPAATPQPALPPASGSQAEPHPSVTPSLAAPTPRPITPAPGLPSGLLREPDGQPHNPATAQVAADYPPAPDRNLFQLAAQLSREADPALIPRVVNPEPVSYTEGREDTFWLVDFLDMKVYQEEFELKLVTPRAYWYVEKGQSAAPGELERAAAKFEADIYPRVTAVFGSEWSPGVDNDPHLNIVHAGLQGVAGYFSSSDEHPQIVYPYSNQRETIYLNSRSLRIGSEAYLEVLAHELQHAINWNGDPSEETWLNEGLSELSVTIAGYSSPNMFRFMSLPTVSLVHWPLDNVNISAYYGGASLFTHYLWEHYSNGQDLRQLITEPADDIAGIDAYLKQAGYNVTFREVFRDWVVANVLDQAQGVYGYADLEAQASVTRSINSFSQFNSEIPQYAAEYVELESFTGPVRLRFQAPAENRLLPTDVGPDGCWWSNAGDSINSTLTSAVDLTGRPQAALSYEVWYNVEEDWDYAYVEVSQDDGQTWEILETPHTSPENPIGNSFGPGYTGPSQGWISERVDLTAYAGQEVLLRFQYVTDDAISGAGLCFRGISAPEAGLAGDGLDWQAAGFVFISNRVKQDYLVQVIEIGPEEERVSALALDANNAGEIVIPASLASRQLIVAVAALAPQTLQPASYTLIVEPAR